MNHRLPPLVSSISATQKIRRSTILLDDLLAAAVSSRQIEDCFSPDGCGAVIIELNDYWNTIYNQFYFLQWQLGERVHAADSDAREKAGAALAELELPIRRLLCRSGVAVARARAGIEQPFEISENDLARFGGGACMTSHVGRPLAANRYEFHPSVEWLIEQEKMGRLEVCPDPVLDVVKHTKDDSEIIGRVEADEARLLAIYRGWEAASPEERCGDGNKNNGDIYYGAFRGRPHFDAGRTLTVLFGPGELRDRFGAPPKVTAEARELGGTLMVAAPGEEQLTPLPFRLPNGAAYIVVFFEQYLPQSAASAQGINTNKLGWAPTLHGVQRIFDTRFSRGQSVLHVLIDEVALVARTSARTVHVPDAEATAG